MIEQRVRRGVAGAFVVVPLAILAGFAAFVVSAAAAQTTDETESAERGPHLPSTLFGYADVELPAHYLSNDFGDGLIFQNAAIENDNTPSNNPITNEGATLGRVLFYDTQLSANGTVSCGSCHIQEFAFSDPDVLSVGFDGATTRRHSMSLVNARFYQRGKFFWDERAETLEEQVLTPFLDQVEMGLTLDELVTRVENQPYYEPLVIDAFGDPDVTPDRIAAALAQFVRSIISINAPYDEGRAQVASPFEPFPSFSRLENDGKSIFLTTGCSTCHVSEAFVNGPEGPQNNGLDLETIVDRGAFEVAENSALLGSFKVPSLRNVAVSGPYMHDGRFASLDEVVEHYSSGIQDHPNLGVQLEPSNSLAFRTQFSPYQKEALVAFLETLTDEVALTSERLSDPFGLPQVRSTDDPIMTPIPRSGAGLEQAEPLLEDRTETDPSSTLALRFALLGYVLMMAAFVGVLVRRRRLSSAHDRI